MNRYFKQFILLLCLAGLLITAVACGEKQTNAPTATTVQGNAGNPADPSNPDAPFDYAAQAPVRDYDAEELRILGTLQAQQFFDDSSHIDLVRSAAVTRNEKVEDLFNLSLKYTFIDGNGANEVGFAETVRNTCLGGMEDAYSLVLPQTYYGVALGLEGLYHNFESSNHIKWEADWYYHDINENASIMGQTYFLASAYLMDKISAAEVIYYNVGIGESYGINEDEIYQKVVDGEWTLEALRAYAALADGHETVIGCVSSLHGIRGLMIAMDTPFVSRNDAGAIRIDYYNDHLVNAFDKVYSFFNDYDYVEKESGDEILAKFPEGNAMFAITYIHSMLEVNNVNSEVDYMILPLPKWNVSQEKYVSDVQRWEMVSVPISADFERACIALDALSYYTYEGMIPTYWESLLGTRFARNEKATEIVNLIRESIYFDFTAIFQIETRKIYSGSGGNPNVAFLIANGRNELASWWGELGPVYPDLLEALFLKYSELAERQ